MTTPLNSTHRIADLSFRRQWVRCTCGHEVHVRRQADDTVASLHARLAETYRVHRSRSEAA